MLHFTCQLGISRIIDKIIPEIVMWQQRLLESVYPIMYIDGIKLKIREDYVHKVKLVYLIISVNIEGKKEILSFWIEVSESSKQWLMINHFWWT